MDVRMGGHFVEMDVGSKFLNLKEAQMNFKNCGSARVEGMSIFLWSLSDENSEIQNQLICKSKMSVNCRKQHSDLANLK